MHRTVAWKVDMHVVPLSHFCMLFCREVLSHSGYAEKKRAIVACRDVLSHPGTMSHSDMLSWRKIVSHSGTLVCRGVLGTLVY